MTPVLFGIKNCDSVRKARAFLDAHQRPYRFHDYKSLGIDAAHLARWCEAAGWQAVLNRAGTTFRKLDEAAKADLREPTAIALMIEQPSLIKRPILEAGEAILVGFRPNEWEAALALKSGQPAPF